MKTPALNISFLLLTCMDLLAQSSMTIPGGGAVNVNGNTYIVPPVFTCGNPFSDSHDGKGYPAVQIGAQCWMAQNFNVGTKINGSGSPANNSIIEKYCYNDDENNWTTYGG